MKRRTGSIIEQSEIDNKIKILFNTTNEATCLSVKLNCDGSAAGVGLSNGAVNIFEKDKPNILYKLNEGRSKDSRGFSATSLSFRPSSNGGSNKILIVTFSNPLHTIEEKREILTCDYSPTANTFATAGADGILNVYDDETRKLLKSYKPPFDCKAEFQRIYSVMYNPNRPNEILTGGWNQTVTFFDLRLPKSFREFYGPQICGEGLSINSRGSEICSASWRQKSSLEIWSYECGKLIDRFECDESSVGSSSGHSGGRRSEYKTLSSLSVFDKLSNKIPSRRLYTAKFYKNDFILVGGTQLPSISVINKHSHKLMASVKNFPNGVYSLDCLENVVFVTGQEFALLDLFL